jgi:hypothetical protein
LASAVVLPAINKIGVGWFSTISAIFLVLATVLTYITAVFGKSWREKIDARIARKQANDMSEQEK